MTWSVNIWTRVTGDEPTIYCSPTSKRWNNLLPSVQLVLPNAMNQDCTSYRLLIPTATCKRLLPPKQPLSLSLSPLRFQDDCHQTRCRRSVDYSFRWPRCSRQSLVAEGATAAATPGFAKTQNPNYGIFSLLRRAWRKKEPLSDPA